MNWVRRVARLCEALYALLAGLLWTGLPFPPGAAYRFTSAALGAVALTAALIAWRLGRPSPSTWRAAMALAAVCILNHAWAIFQGGEDGMVLLSIAAALQAVVFIAALSTPRIRTVEESTPGPAA